MDFQAVCLLLLICSFAKSQDPTSGTQNSAKKPFRAYLLTYSTSPKHVQMDLDGGFYRYGYVTDDEQYRAERRKADGTVVGYYGYVDPNGKAIRVNYTAGKDTGFVTKTEEVELTYPSGIDEPNPTKLADSPVAVSPSLDNNENLSPIINVQDPVSFNIDNENDSVFVETPILSRSPPEDEIYRHPLIDFPLVMRTVRSLRPSRSRNVAKRDITNLQKIQEIIRESYKRKNPTARQYQFYEGYEKPIWVLADPAADNILLTVRAHYTVED